MTAIDDAITRARAALLTLLRDTATITHTPLVFSGGTQHKGTPVVTSGILVNVQRTLGASAQSVADSLSVVNPAVLRFPVGTAVAAGDAIAVGARSFVAVVALSDTNELTSKVLCREVIG